MAWDNLFNIVPEISNGLILLLGGVLMYVWLKPFLAKKRLAGGAAAVYTALVLLLVYLPYEISDSLVRLLPLVVTALLLIVFERRNYRQKVLLVILFVLLRWLTIGFLGEVGFFERDLIYGIPFMTRSISAMIAEFLIWQLVYAGGALGALYFALRSVQKVYRAKAEEVTWQEFMMLITPMLALFSVKPMYKDYYMLWSQGIANGTILKNIPGSVYRLFFYLSAYLATVFLLYFYQEIKNKQEELVQRELLAQQIEENKRSLDKLQAVYENMRSLKHDMGNHIAVIEQALSADHTEDATQYAKALRDKLNEVRPLVATGNPITDIVLSDAAEKCAEEGIAFASKFVFPEGSGIDVFDLTTVVSNALINAVEAAQGLQAPMIAISSLREGGAYIISVKNTIGKALTLSEDSLPVSEKSGEGHGYGLKNIRNVAQKYEGGLRISQEEEDGRLLFRLDVMLADTGGAGKSQSDLPSAGVKGKSGFTTKMRPITTYCDKWVENIRNIWYR